MKSRRHAIIRNLIAAGDVSSQAELAKRLSREGVDATQATLSRDLAEIGVLKGPAGYLLPEVTRPATRVTTPADSAPASGALARVLRRELVSIDVGGTLVVLKTPIGHGNALAIELDRANLDGALGTIAGDDTVFVAARSELAARRLAKHMRDMAQLS
jgi:transcriptional regulator of arginine metabolism